jgi:hypothetical protein
MRSLLVVVALFCLTYAGCGGSGGEKSSGTVPPQSGGGGVTDTSPPQLMSTTPAHNSTAVGLNLAITATFNEAIDPATVTPSTLSLVADATGVAVGGTVSYENSSRTAILRPQADLSAGAAYTATVAAEVADLAGNKLLESYTWQFSTGVTPDTSAPTVSKTYPSQDAAAVPRNTAVAVTFNEGMDPTSINSQTFILFKDDNTQVPGSVTYVGSSALFRPSENLLAGAVYRARVTSGVSGVSDLAGNPLAEDFLWEFTTGSDADLVAPQVQSVLPEDEEQEVPVDSPLVITFNEPIMPFAYGLLDFRPVAVTFNDTYTTVTMIPTDGLQPGITYTAVLSTQDMAGIRMSEPFVWEFSTTSP